MSEINLNYYPCGEKHNESLGECVFPYCCLTAGHSRSHQCLDHHEWGGEEQTAPERSDMDDTWEQSRNEFIAKLSRLHDEKREKYTARGEHPLANYLQASERFVAMLQSSYPEAAQHMGRLGAIPAMVVRLSEKLHRVAVTVGRQEVFHTENVAVGESLEDNLLDIANIALLIYCELKMIRWPTYTLSFSATHQEDHTGRTTQT